MTEIEYTFPLSLTEEERKAVEEQKVLQDISINKVIIQALRHYQAAVKGKIELNKLPEKPNRYDVKMYFKDKTWQRLINGSFKSTYIITNELMENDLVTKIEISRNNGEKK